MILRTHAPHPVLLPTGEGTPKYRSSVQQRSLRPRVRFLPTGEGTLKYRSERATAFPLPWGEGQGEGSEL